MLSSCEFDPNLLVYIFPCFPSFEYMWNTGGRETMFTQQTYPVMIIPFEFEKNTQKQRFSCISYHVGGYQTLCGCFDDVWPTISSRWLSQGVWRPSLIPDTLKAAPPDSPYTTARPWSHPSPSLPPRPNISSPPQQPLHLRPGPAHLPGGDKAGQESDRHEFQV